MLTCLGVSSIPSMVRTPVSVVVMHQVTRSTTAASRDRRSRGQREWLREPRIMPSSIAAPAANYAHAVLAEGPSACCTPRAWCRSRPTAPCRTTSPTQATVVWSNIVAILDEAEMAVTDIVSVTTYVVVGEPTGRRDGRARPRAGGPPGGQHAGPGAGAGAARVEARDRRRRRPLNVEAFAHFGLADGPECAIAGVSIGSGAGEGIPGWWSGRQESLDEADERGRATGRSASRRRARAWASVLPDDRPANGRRLARARSTRRPARAGRVAAAPGASVNMTHDS